MNFNENNNTAQSTMDSIKETTYKILDSLEEGKRTTLRDLTDKVIFETKFQVSIVNGLVPMLVHEWVRNGNGSIDKGRNGGIYKGGKPIRIDSRPRCPTCNQVDRKLITKIDLDD